MKIYDLMGTDVGGSFIAVAAGLTTCLDTVFYATIKGQMLPFLVSAVAGALFAIIASNCIGRSANIYFCSNGFQGTQEVRRWTLLNVAVGMLPSACILVSQRALAFFAQPIVAGLRLGFICSHIYFNPMRDPDA